jgi:tetratricopeptide (TPR) repeat protein
MAFSLPRGLVEIWQQRILCVMHSLYCFMNSTGRKQVTTLGLASLLLCACANQGTQPSDQVPESGPVPGDSAQAAAEENLPPTDAEVMYRVFAAEYMGSEGDLEKAASEYLAAALSSEDPEVAERATAVALAAEAWQYAAMAADRWVVLAPEDVLARETAARSLLMAGDYVGAEHQISGLLGLMEDDPLGAWNTVASLLSVSVHPEKAEQILDRLIEENEAQENPYALFAGSQLAARTGNLEQAVSLSDQSVALAPDQAELHAWAGRLAANTGREADAAEHFGKAWALQPEDRSYALMYANLLRQNGEMDKANEILGELPDEPELRFTRIAFSLESGDRPLAEQLYAGFETADYPHPADAAFQAARSAELLEWAEEAILWYSRVDSGERVLMAVVRRAVLLAGMGRIEDARQALAQARNSGDPVIRLETLIVESQLLIDAGQPEAAFQMLEEAIEQDPGDLRLRYTRALVAVELDRLDIAERDLRRVLDNEPGNATALNALGYTLADRTDRYEEAERLINQAYSLQPDEASIIDSMGWIAFRLGRLEEAEAYLREAYRRDRNAEIAAHLGEVLWVLGRQSEARQVWQEGRSIDAANRVLQDTLDRFEVTL